MAWLDDNREWLEAAKRWLPVNVEPLRLRAWLLSPIAWDGYNGVTIEGALQSAVIWRETHRSPGDVFAGFDGAVEIPIPIADVEIHGHTIACASWAVPPPIAFESVRWNRSRARPEQYAMNVVRIGQGPYKSSNIPFSTLTTPFLDFFVRGDLDLLSELLPDVSGLGRANGIGYGTVFCWDIAPDEADRSCAFERRPQRSLPEAMGAAMEPDSFSARAAGLRAPYWVRHNQAPAIVPSGPFGAPAWEAT